MYSSFIIISFADFFILFESAHLIHFRYKLYQISLKEVFISLDKYIFQAVLKDKKKRSQIEVTQKLEYPDSSSSSHVILLTDNTIYPPQSNIRLRNYLVSREKIILSFTPSEETYDFLYQDIDEPKISGLNKIKEYQFL